MSGTIHATKIVTEDDGKSHWVCTCGKRGDNWIIRRDAEIWAKMHEKRPGVLA